MSTDLDALAESARNRGLKLVRSRVRTPGKRRFGKVGLTDTKGKAVFGMDDKGPTAKPEEVEAYLRDLGATDWSASLGAAAASRARKKAKPKPAPKPPPPPKPAIREARPADAPALTELIRYLGHEIDEPSVRKNIAALKRGSEAPLVATLGKQVVGLVGLHRTPTIHRDAPLGRITILVVAEAAQGSGLGRMLVDAAEERLRGSGCKMAEVTSNDRRARAHDFYRHLGYDRTSARFAKTL